eukprot:CAMPEP_0197672018 /NCGR_PEP_ID=MMETSP1338-20131121/77959_1 /TAXON_ID=43686 ORGANISM="Pelagodinium beii, Strain RCC1491" /NCGR_SAMPLE_ID=MMETSP1338 /ASSEMBLY_ACC=CAM_ASM_000754 /LENGTH=52 /DNA_ID=CAMNT_0043252029 /DNA_START=302 /DNA_END=457 /DNA_ORIENTATION=-
MVENWVPRFTGSLPGVEAEMSKRWYVLATVTEEVDISARDGNVMLLVPAADT